MRNKPVGLTIEINDTVNVKQWSWPNEKNTNNNWQVNVRQCSRPNDKNNKQIIVQT